MKHLTTLLLVAMGVAASTGAHAQSAAQITIVSEPESWYVNTPQGPAPSPDSLIAYPELTTIPGAIPESWHVTRLDPWTQARVMWINGALGVVTWGSSRVLPNLHEYRTPFREMTNGKPYYTRADLPVGHSMQAEFHLADRNHDGRISQAEHAAFFGAH